MSEATDIAARRAARIEPAEKFAPGERQTVLVFQGGGALGAYHAGVLQALHEAGIEPDWIIGTSIGAINAALIAGNPVDERLAKLEEFWRRVRQSSGWTAPWAWPGLADAQAYWT